MSSNFSRDPSDNLWLNAAYRNNPDEIRIDLDKCINTNINNIPDYLFNTIWNAAEAVFKVTAVIGTVTAGATFGAPLFGVAVPTALAFNGWWCASFFAGTTSAVTARQIFSDVTHSKDVLEYTDYYSGGYGDQIADFLDIAFATTAHGVRNFKIHSFLFPYDPHLYAALYGMLDGFFIFC